MPDATFNLSPHGWPQLDEYNWIDVVPNWSQQLIEKLETSDAQAAADSAAKAEAAAKLVDAAAAASNMPELGSAASGMYARWSNGLQICWYNGPLSFPATAPYGSLHQAFCTWNYPRPFTAPPAVFARVCWDTSARTWGSVMGVTATGCQPIALDVAARAARAWDASVVAIGRWK